MRVLVLGGGSFVGRAAVEELLARGHEPVLFSRGRTGSDLFPGVERRLGDRDTGDYASLSGSTWDAVLDVSAYVPRHVAQASDAVDAGRYLLVSTGSVYDKDRASAPLDEDAPRLPPERGTEEVTREAYGPLKVACEDDVLARWGAAATVVRPGIVAGPHDPTDRFTYWARRCAAGGRVALPGRPDQPVQVVDSRDLARLMASLLEGDVAGTFNAVGPAEPVTLGELLTTCGADEVVPVAPVEGFPLCLPDPSWDVVFRRSADRARAHGLTATPLAQTAADVRAWDDGRGRPELTGTVVLTAEQEAELLG